MRYRIGIVLAIAFVAFTAGHAIQTIALDCDFVPRG